MKFKFFFICAYTFYLPGDLYKQAFLLFNTQYTPNIFCTQWMVHQDLQFYFAAADLSNYHYAGRTRGYQGNLLGGGPLSSPINGGVTTAPHRPAVFRTGWE